MSRTRNEAIAGNTLSGVVTNLFYDGTASDPRRITNTTTDNFSCSDGAGSWTMTDVVTPDYHKRIRNGEIINNPMTTVTTLVEDQMTSYSRAFIWKDENNNDALHGQKHSGMRNVGSLCKPWISLPAIDDDVIDIAVTKAWANADLSEATGLVMAAEANKTIKTLTDIMAKVVRLAIAFKRLRVKEILGELSPRELSNSYLQLRYGVRPLLYDARSVQEALQQGLGTDRRTFRGFSSESADVDDVYTAYNSASSNIQTVRTAEVRVEARAGVLCKIDAISGLNTWGFDQPLEAMWELMPYSFILDWFFNFGETIASWTPEGGLKDLASWVVVTTTATQRNIVGTLTNKPAGSYDYADYWNWSGAYTCTSIKKQRIVDPERSVLPTFRLRLDALKLLDLVLIGKQILAKT